MIIVQMRNNATKYIRYGNTHCLPRSLLTEYVSTEGGFQFGLNATTHAASENQSVLDFHLG